MEQDRFDQLARGLAAGRSRREIVRRLAGTALGGALAAVGVHATEAKPQPRATLRRAHHPPAADAADHTPPTTTAPTDHQAPCHKKKHPCPAGLTRCTVGKKRHGKRKKACVDLQTDAQHCGTCAMVCGSGQACVAGACAGPCVPDCQGKQCGDDGCGGTCGACPSGQTCQQGQCACPAGQTDCTGQCVDTGSDVANCGACGTVCALPHTTVNKCVGGVCEASQCERGWGSCGDPSQGCATDITSDAANCGACDDPCAFGQRCQNGTCLCDAQSCPGCCDGTTCAGGDADGACGHGGELCQPCASPQTCGGGDAAGVCGCSPTTCAAWHRTCGPLADGCGATLDCGTCPDGQSCQNGTCQAICTPFYKPCDPSNFHCCGGGACAQYPDCELGGYCC